LAGNKQNACTEYGFLDLAIDLGSVGGNVHRHPPHMSDYAKGDDQRNDRHYDRKRFTRHEIPRFMRPPQSGAATAANSVPFSTWP
jgi:hypothetical protein